MDHNSNEMKAVVLLSGGMDSCVTAAIASRNYQIAALHTSYGQPTERRERQSFHALADYFGAVARMAVKLDHLRSIGGSRMMDFPPPTDDANPPNPGITDTHFSFPPP